MDLISNAIGLGTKVRIARNVPDLAHHYAVHDIIGNLEVL